MYESLEKRNLRLLSGLKPVLWWAPYSAVEVVERLEVEARLGVACRYSILGYLKVHIEAGFTKMAK